MKKGLLISFEGGEGSGKTTYIYKLKEELKTRGIAIEAFHEPGGTDISNEIRAIVHDLNHLGVMDRKTESLLYQAARAQIVAQEIRPALEQGKIILLGRYRDSSVVYQGYARNLGAYLIDTLNEFSTDNLIPDLTLYLDIPAEIGLQRKKEQEEWNRLDAQPLDFHHKIREAYLLLCQTDETNRWHYVDANRPLEEVYSDILNAVELKLTKAGFIERIGANPERLG